VSPVRLTLTLLVAAALVVIPREIVAAASVVSFTRTDIAMPAAPDSVAIGDLDGQHGKDIVVALPSSGGVGVLLNNGDGTFAPMQPYTAGPNCGGLAVDITLGDVTTPAPGDRLQPDGKLDAYVACTPYVVRLTGDGNGALTNPESFGLGLPQYLGSQTLDLLALTRRPDGNPVPLLVIQHAVGQFGRQLCLSYELDPAQLVCNATPVQGPLAVGDLNGAAPTLPPDEIVTAEPLPGPDVKMGVFGFGWVPGFPTQWNDGTRDVPGDPPGQPGLESATVGDLDDDADTDVLVGQPVNSLDARKNSIHLFRWGPSGLAQVAEALPSTPGVDAVAIADVDADGCNDVLAAGTYGTGMVHLSDGAGGFDGGQDLPQLGYQNPATATRVTMAVGDLTGDGRPDVVISDAIGAAVMVYRNTSTGSGVCATAPPPPPPPPPPTSPATCASPGVTPFLVGTAADDVVVGTSGRDVLRGNGGDDCLFGFSGDDRMTGGTGNDRLNGSSGDDRMNGDAGADRLDGGVGKDQITPGAGADQVKGGGGDDSISARDGTRDTIDCGSGRDKVTADRNDRVDRNCESVRRPDR
jgi:RTX calcium-binding nonapeptide repeat (4 copies)/FG-GAP-like repeat